MDSPTEVYSPTQAGRDIIVSSIARFLDPEVIRVLATASSGYESSVAKISNDRLTKKRQVEEIVGEELSMPGNEEHDWNLTHKILRSEEREALWYTGSDVDVYIANKVGAVKPTTEDEFEFVMQNAAENGDVEIFNMLMNVQDYQLEDEQYESFVHNAVINDHVGILDNDKMISIISAMDEERIESNLESMIEFQVSPRTIDFFLSNITIQSSYAYAERVYDAIAIYGAYNVLFMMMKHDMLNPISELRRMEGDDEEWTPLELSLKHGYADIVKLFLEDPRVEKVDGFDVGDAIRAGHVSVVEALLNSGKTEMYNGYIVVAVKSGIVEMVKLFLSYPISDVSRDNNVCIKNAVNNNRTEIALLLLNDPRIRLTQSEKEALIATAKYYGNTTLERTLRLFG